MGADLEACPFCGGRNIERVDDGCTQWNVCRTCGCDGPVARTQEHRVRLWNTRAAHAITPAMIDRAAAAFDATAWDWDARTSVDAVRPAIEAALRAALEFQ